MNVVTGIGVFFGLLFFWAGWHVMYRSSGKPGGETLGMLLVVLGFIVIAAAFLIRGVFPAFV